MARVFKTRDALSAHYALKLPKDLLYDSDLAT